MGAFGNYPHIEKPKIDFSQLNTVSVIANFNPEGKIKPEYFKFVNADQSEKTIKIDSIKYTKEYDNRISFCCIYTIYGKQREVMLTFYVAECIWVI